MMSSWCVRVFSLMLLVAIPLQLPLAEALTQAQTKCSPGFQPALSCPPPATQGTPITGSGICCSCPLGSYSADGNTCKACVTSASGAQSGVNLQKSGTTCSCIDGFGDYDTTSATCRRCPVNTYSLNSKCVACAAGTFSPMQSTSCGPVYCPSDSYLPPGGSTISDCVRCKFGTVGQSCSNVQVCKCLAGYAGFDPVSGQCKQCSALNSISIYTDMTNPNESNTTCYVCPRGTSASGDKRVCLQTATVLSSSGSTDPVFATSFPTLPIPPIPCTCLNGYDYYVALVSSGQTQSTTLSHAVSYTVDQTFTAYTSTNALNTAIPFIFITDADTNRLVGMLTTSQTDVTLSGSNYPSYEPFMTHTCDEMYAKFSVTSAVIPCIKIKSDAPVTSIVPQLKAQGWDVMQSGWDFQVGMSCALTMQFADCTDVFVVTISDIVGGQGVSLQSNAASAIGTVVGDGSSKFGIRVIAFYDANNVVRMVLAAPPSGSAGNFYLTTKHASVGSKCAVGTTVALCYPMSNQHTQFNDILNSIAPGAIAPGGDYRFVSDCNDIVNPF